MTAQWVDAVTQQWPDTHLDTQSKDLTLVTPLDQLHAILTFLKNDGQTRMDFLRMIAAVDYPEHIELVYQLFSYPLRHSISIKTNVPKQKAVAPTMVDLWPAANWHEREAFDLLGVTFEGHPDMTRLLLPDDWEGYPLRKDYQPKDHYRGVSTERTYPTTLPSFSDPMKEGDA